MGTLQRTLAATIALGLVAHASPTPATAAAKKKASLSGSIGVTAPAGGKSLVRAVSLADRSIVTARKLTTNGAFKLSLPAGSYLMVGTVLTGKTPTTKQIAVTLKPGQKRTKTRLTAKLRKSAKKASARAAYKTVQGSGGRKGVSAVGVNPFDAPPESAGDLHYFAQGASALMTVDLVNNVAKRCPGKVVVHEVNPEIVKALDAEAALGRSPYADKSSFPPQRRIISNVRIDGSVSPEGVVTIVVKDTGTREVITTLTEPLGDDPFATLSRQTATITDLLCARVGGYDVKLDVTGTYTSVFGYTATARYRGTLAAEAEPSQSWSGREAFEWMEPTFTSSRGCVFSDPVLQEVAWSAQIRAVNSKQISVAWSVTPYDDVTATEDCPPEGPNTSDPPPRPRQPGPGMAGASPLNFTLPLAGGSRSIDYQAGDRKVTGTLTIRKVKTP